jgi:dynein heavy chain
VSGEIEEKLERARKVARELSGIVDIYDDVAKQGACLYFAITDLANVCPMYQFSLTWFSKIYMQAIKDAERSKHVAIRVKNLVGTFQLMLFKSICVSLLEPDKLLFVFLMAVRVLRNRTDVSEEAWRMLITEGSPASGDAAPVGVP